MERASNIILKNGLQIPYYIFNGEKDIKSLEQVLYLNEIHIPIYYLYINKEWFACAFDGWRAFILGENEIHYLSLDGHWLRKKVVDGIIKIDNELIPNGFSTPSFLKTGIFDNFKKLDSNLQLYWKYENQIVKYKDCLEMKKTASLFLSQFFSNAWFTSNIMKYNLSDWFEENLLNEFESSFMYGVWGVNPFTWRVKTGPLSAPYYASFYNFIEQKPFASFPMNAYGKKRNKNI